jgi:hypothetical protein
VNAKPTDRKEALEQSVEMAPVQGTVEVDVPIAELWEAFAHGDWWPRWNKCFFWAHNRTLVAGRKLIWAFQPIRWYYLYKMFAIANIVEVESQSKVTWEVTALPGFYARHTYRMEDLGNGRSRFGSWEQAMGAQLRFAPTRHFWIAHFTFVEDKSLEDAKTLEAIYRRDGKITKAALPRKRSWPFALSALTLLLVIISAGIVGWFYASSDRPHSHSVRCSPLRPKVLATAASKTKRDHYLPFEPYLQWDDALGQGGRPLSAADLELQLDSYTGNTNSVLASELTDSKEKLLFVGDA